MAKIFLSYSRQDAAFAQQLRQALIAAQHEVWLDTADLLPTEQWRDEIRRNILTADSFLFLVDAASLRSKECQRELSFATENNKRIIPLVLGAVSNEEAGEPLGSLNWITARAYDFDATMRDLLAAIALDLPYIQQSRQILVEAHRWDDNAHKASYLLRGDALKQATTWQEKSRGKPARERPTAVQAQFIAASRQAAGARQRTLLGSGLGAALLVTIASIVVTVTILGQNAKIAAQNTTLLSQNLAARGTALLQNGALDEGALLSAAANRVEDNAATRTALLSTLETSPYLESFLQSNFANPDLGQAIVGAAFSTDGKTLIALDQMGQVKRWDVASHRLISATKPTAPGTQYPWLAAAISPGGKYIAAADLGVVGIIDATTGAFLGPLVNVTLQNAEPAHGIALAPDGHTLAVADCADAAAGGCAAPGVVTLYDLAHSGKVIGHLPLNYPPAWVNLAFEPTHGNLLAISECATDPTTLSTCVRDSDVLVYNVTTEQLIYHYALPLNSGSELTAIAFSADGLFLAASGCAQFCSKGLIMEWPSQGSAAPLADDTLDVGRADQIALNADGTSAVVATESGQLRQWAVALDQPLGEPMPGHTKQVTQLAYAPDNFHFVSADVSNQVLLWRSSPYSALTTPIYNDVSVPQFLPNGSLLAGAFTFDATTQTYRSQLQFWDVGNDRLVDTLDVTDANHQLVLTAFAVSANGGFVATQLCDLAQTVCHLAVWNLASKQMAGQMVALSASEAVPALGTTLQSVSADGRYLVTQAVLLPAAPFVEATLWDSSTATALHQFPATTGPDDFRGSTWSGSLLALTTAQQGVIFWDAHANQSVSPLHQQAATEAIDARFSDDGSLLAVMDGVGNVALWDMRTGNRTATLAAQPSGAVAQDTLAFSHDGKTLATLYGDQASTRLTLWSVAQQTAILGPLLQSQTMQSITISPDGSRLAFVPSAITSLSGHLYAVVVLPTASSAWRDDACALANRNLTHSEWQALAGTAPYQVMCPQFPVPKN